MPRCELCNVVLDEDTGGISKPDGCLKCGGSHWLCLGCYERMKKAGLTVSGLMLSGSPCLHVCPGPELVVAFRLMEDGA